MVSGAKNNIRADQNVIADVNLASRRRYLNIGVSQIVRW